MASEGAATKAEEGSGGPHPLCRPLSHSHSQAQLQAQALQRQTGPPPQDSSLEGGGEVREGGTEGERGRWRG